MRIHNSILEAVGATPLIALDRIRSKDGARLLLKMELLNPGASMKDRIALQIIEDAEESGRLKPGGDVVELTSGNTGIALAMACAVKGYRMTAVMSEGNSVERRSILSALGARVELVAQAGGSAPGLVSKEDMELVEERTQELVRELAAFRPDQFNNESNPRAHELGTGREIWEQTGGQVDAFAAAVGTGGTFIGVSRALKSRNPRVKCYAVEPAGAPYLAGKEVTNTRHQIQGAGYAMTPGFWDESLADGYLRRRGGGGGAPLSASGGRLGRLLDGGESGSGRTHRAFDAAQRRCRHGGVRFRDAVFERGAVSFLRLIDG